MPWKHVFDPTKGIISSRPPSGIPPEASPYIKGCYIKNGEVRSDFGMTNFPEPGALKTNALLGTIMSIDQFFLLSGTSYLLAFTTRYLYQYNTSTTTWDVVIKGTLLENCEDAWVASANVTATADTSVKLRGTASSKMVIASGFTTGIVAYEDISSTDISAAANTYLSFWVYCDTAVASGVFRFRLSEQVGGGTGATYADYTVPAITASTWQHVSVAIASPVASSGGTYPTDLNAVLSVSLVAQSDPGAVTVYIDDVRTAQEFTGDEDNRFSVTTLADKFVFTNGVDLPGQLVDSSGLVHTSLTLTLPTGAITTSEVVLAFKDHVLYMNNTENGADTPQRVSWTNIGSVTDHTAGTSGFQDLVDDPWWIIGAAVLSENTALVYKEDSIALCTWVGGHTPFRFKTILTSTGITSKDGFAEGDDGHIVMGRVGIYHFPNNGTNQIESLDDNIKRSFYDNLDETYSNRAFIIDNREDDEFQIYIPTVTATPDEGWTQNIVDKAWYVKSRNISGFGFYKAQSSLTIGDLVGTIGDQNWTFGSQLVKANFPIILVGDTSGKLYKIDKLTLNNAGTAITNEFETSDFVLPDEPEYLNKFMYVTQLKYEAYGQSITTHWSEDEGATWSPTQGAGTNVQALTSIPVDYQQDFEASVKKIRFRFRNESLSSGFNLKYYGFFWLPRTGRK